MRAWYWIIVGWICASPALAVDSYRYMHVTIETPWHIFLALLVAVLSPFILMAILYWRYALRKPGAEKPADQSKQE